MTTETKTRKTIATIETELGQQSITWQPGYEIYVGDTPDPECPAFDSLTAAAEYVEKAWSAPEWGLNLLVGPEDFLTTAEIIAAELDDDGQRYETDDGRKFLDLIAEHDGELTAARDGGRVVRYHFPDGSAIVDAEVAWDLGYAGDDFCDCTCWPDALVHHGHYRECAMAEETAIA